MSTEWIEAEWDGVRFRATREEVHRLGYWHETFHCFVLHPEGLLLQRRSPQKRDFPGMYDITAAGHLSYGEGVKDGIRELKEEIGLVRRFDELTPIGTIEDELILPPFIDRERCHVFLTETDQPLESFLLQTEEVDCLVAVRTRDFISFLRGENEMMEVAAGPARFVGWKEFVPHGENYRLILANRLEIHINS